MASKFRPLTSVSAVSPARRRRIDLDRLTTVWVGLARQVIVAEAHHLFGATELRGRLTLIEETLFHRHRGGGLLLAEWEAQYLHDEAECAEQVRALGERPEAAGIRWVSARSGPNGRRHVWATLSQPASLAEMTCIAHALKGVAPRIDISPLLNQRAEALRPPGSPHRIAGVAVWEGDPAGAKAVLLARNSAAAWQELLRWAQRQNHPGADTPQAGAVRCGAVRCGAVRCGAVRQRRAAAPGRAPHLGRERRELSGAMEALLFSGERAGDQHDRSAVTAALTLAMVVGGLDFPRLPGGGQGSQTHGSGRSPA